MQVRGPVDEAGLASCRRGGGICKRLIEGGLVECMVALLGHSIRPRPRPASGEYEPGFCKSEALEEVVRQGYMLTPGCYVGALS